MLIPPTSAKQLIYTYKVKKNVSNTAFNTHYYPTARPLQHYRKEGIHSAQPTSITSDQPCICSSSKEVGLPIKMLAKDKDGKTTTCCSDTQGPLGPNGPTTSNTGNVMSFSGYAKLKSAIQPKNNSYHSESYSYLKSRGNTFSTKYKFRDIPDTDYKNPINSSYYELQEGLPSCGSPSYIKTTYKPNNKNFATQGAVSSDTRLLKLKYDTIKKTNLSYVKPFNTVLYYSDAPIFFEKNKIEKCYNRSHCTTTTANTPVEQAALFAVPGAKT